MFPKASRTRTVMLWIASVATCVGSPSSVTCAAPASTTATFAVTIGSPAELTIMTLDVAALTSTIGNGCVPRSAAVKVKSGGSAALGSVEARCTVLAKSVTTLPCLSTAVTMAVSGVPATVDAGMPVTTRLAAGPCTTWVTAGIEVAIDGVKVSAAASDCWPAVANCTATTFVPRSTGLNGRSGIAGAPRSLFVK
jgi:hypothetical protein